MVSGLWKSLYDLECVQTLSDSSSLFHTFYDRTSPHPPCNEVFLYYSRQHQWLRIDRPFVFRRRNIFLPVRLLIRARNPHRRFRTTCEGSYVSRFPPRTNCSGPVDANDVLLPAGAGDVREVALSRTEGRSDGRGSVDIVSVRSWVGLMMEESRGARRRQSDAAIVMGFALGEFR